MVHSPITNRSYVILHRSQAVVILLRKGNNIKNWWRGTLLLRLDLRLDPIERIGMLVPPVAIRTLWTNVRKAIPRLASTSSLRKPFKEVGASDDGASVTYDFSPLVDQKVLRPGGIVPL